MYKFYARSVKRDEEIRTDKDRWFWILRNLSKADKIPAFMNKRVFQRIFKIAEVSNLSEEERMAYEASLQDKWIWSSAMSMAEKKAAKEATEKERAKADQEKLESARSLKKIGLLTDEQIANSLQLPFEVVEKLK